MASSTTPTPGSAAAVLDEIRAWLRRRSASVYGSEVEIDLDVDLIESRVVDSLSFMNFIMLLEELSGRPIETRDAQSIKVLRTLRSIRDNVLGAADGAADEP